MRSRIILTCLIAAGLAVAQSSVINVAPGEAEKNIVARVEPTIPPLARAARIGGNVVLRIRVSDAGNVTQVNVVSGHPMLQGAAMEAVRKWKYKPFTQNGAAVAIETQVTVAFSGGMSQSESDVRNKFFPQLEKCRGSLKEGDYPEAEKECSKAVDISNDLPKNVVLERSTARSLLGHSLFRQRRVREAIPVYVEALHLDESYLKADDADLATDYANVARAFAAVGGELTKADVFYAQAVKTFEAAIQSLPSMKENYTKRLIRTLDEYAQIKEALGQSGAANELHRKADALSR